jgi:hypothetical protein
MSAAHVATIDSMVNARKHATAGLWDCRDNGGWLSNRFVINGSMMILQK